MHTHMHAPWHTFDVTILAFSYHMHDMDGWDATLFTPRVYSLGRRWRFSVSANASLTSFLTLPKSGSTTACSELFLSFIHTSLIILHGDYVFVNLFPLLDYELLKNKCFILLIFAFLWLSTVPCT